MKDTKFYDLGRVERPFRLREGARIIITGVHEDSELSKHYIGMEAVLVKSHRKWRDKKTRKMWVTAQLHILKSGVTMTFGLVRFKAHTQSKSTLYRKGLLGNRGHVDLMLMTILTILTALAAIVIWGLIAVHRDSTVDTVHEQVTIIRHQLADTRVKLHLVERQLNTLNTHLTKLEVLKPAQRR